MPCHLCCTSPCSHSIYSLLIEQKLQGRFVLDRVLPFQPNFSGIKPYIEFHTPRCSDPLLVTSVALSLGCATWCFAPRY